MKTLTTIIVLLSGIASCLYAGILAGPITNPSNGHIYYLLTATNWNNAEKEAVALGGHLVTINNAAEDQWVYTNFVSFCGTQYHLMIGLTDRCKRRLESEAGVTCPPSVPRLDAPWRNTNGSRAASIRP